MDTPFSSVQTNSAWVMLISGMSGSGKTTAIQALEDEGFFCIDNLPPSVAEQAIEACLKAPEKRKKLALVLDARSGCLLDDAPRMLEHLKSMGYHVEALFLDASDEVLVRRFSETRRRHPMEHAHAGTVLENIAYERHALSRLRALSTRIVDTSLLQRADLRRLVVEHVVHFLGGHRLSLNLISFGFKYGLPAEADWVFDVRHLKNPYFVPELKAHTGLFLPVQTYVFEQPLAMTLLHKIEEMLMFLLPQCVEEGKRYMHVAVGCTGGKHRSVAMIEALYQYFSALTQQEVGQLLARDTHTFAAEPEALRVFSLYKRHRDIERP